VTDTNSETAEPVAINIDLIARIAASWPRRSVVCSGQFDPNRSEPLTADTSDYPRTLVPFIDHPLFQTAPQDLKDQVLTWAWIVYNQRTITAEERVANPAFELIMQGRFPGLNDASMQTVIQQSLIDEHFHTLMHMTAINRTRALRQLAGEPKFPHSVTYRTLLHAQAEVSELWKKQLLTLVFAIVSEISINAYLNLLARDKTIQPMHSRIASFHNRDETAHSKILSEASKSLYQAMNQEQRLFFIKALPIALEAFVAEDFSAWEAILDHVDIAGRDAILGDCRSDKSRARLVRDFSGLHYLCHDLNIERHIDFEFSTYRPQ
jgi:hypothetical protein